METNNTAYKKNFIKNIPFSTDKFYNHKQIFIKVLATNLIFNFAFMFLLSFATSSQLHKQSLGFINLSTMDILFSGPVLRVTLLFAVIGIAFVYASAGAMYLVKSILHIKIKAFNLYLILSYNASLYLISGFSAAIICLMLSFSAATGVCALLCLIGGFAGWVAALYNSFTLTINEPVSKIAVMALFGVFTALCVVIAGYCDFQIILSGIADLVGEFGQKFASAFGLNISSSTIKSYLESFLKSQFNDILF